MELTHTKQFIELLREEFHDMPLQVTFTQWEDDDADEDETTSQFIGTLIETAVSENEFSGLDAAFHFTMDDGDEVIEILMDFPNDGEDVVANYNGETIRIFGNESELLIGKRKGQQ